MTEYVHKDPLGQRESRRKHLGGSQLVSAYCKRLHHETRSSSSASLSVYLNKFKFKRCYLCGFKNVLSPITCDVIHQYAEETCDI